MISVRNTFTADFRGEHFSAAIRGKYCIRGENFVNANANSASDSTQ